MPFEPLPQRNTGLSPAKRLTNEVRMGVSLSLRDAAKGNRSMATIVIAPEIVNELRWQEGDELLVLVGNGVDRNTIMIRRVGAGEYKTNTLNKDKMGVSHFITSTRLPVVQKYVGRETVRHMLTDDGSILVFVPASMQAPA